MKLLRRRILIPATAITVILAGAGISWAFWTTSGTGSASATTATLNPPTNVVATATLGSGTVPVTWNAARLSTGQFAQSYHVTRVSGSDSFPACDTTSTSCSDTSVPDGTYQYVVTAIYHTWTAASAPSAAVTVTNDNIPPTVAIDQASGQADPTATSPIHFAVVFSESVADFTASDVTLTAGTASVTGSGTTYDVAVSMTGSGTVTASIAANAAHDAAGNGNTASTSTDNTVTYDVSGPDLSAPTVAATVTYGNNPIYVSHENVTLTDAASDPAGVDSVDFYYCAGATGTCDGTNGTLITQPWTTAALADGPYRIIAVGTDTLGNATTSPATLIAVDATPPTVSRPTVNGHS